MKYPLTPIEKSIADVLEEIRQADPRFRFEPQREILSYRVDFMLWMVLNKPNGDIRLLKMIVECDGHDFHEKTKQQVAHDKKRDRCLQSLGFRILRFSGSEIYRDPKDCAYQIFAQFQKDAEE